MTTLSEPKVSLYPSETLTGKWNQKSYIVERRLGEGANGTVYLVRKKSTLYAMKIGYDTHDLQSEINALKGLSLYEGAFKDYLFDVDDIKIGNQEYPMYVMKYIRGKDACAYIGSYGGKWLGVIGTHLLLKLRELHGKGYVFGDLKAENLLIGEYGEVELIDFGGVTAMGRSVKQFTEIYDRGYWNSGSRVAEESYDMFSFSVLCLLLMSHQNGDRGWQKNQLPQNRSVEVLLDQVRKQDSLRPYASVLVKALNGEYYTSADMLREWKKSALQVNERMEAIHPKRVVSWVKACFAFSVITFISVLLYFY